MALTVDTTTIPGYTIITDGTGGIAVLPNPPEDSTSSIYSIVNEIADKLDILAIKLQFLEKLESISNSLEKLESISNSLEKLEENQKIITDLAVGDGINFKGPYEWLSMYAIYRLLVEQGITDFNSLKSQIDSLPKNF